MNKFIALLPLILAFQTMATEIKTPEAQNVNNACSLEAKTAGCGEEKVGTGLLKCIHGYKKDHKNEFKLSEGCKTALKSYHRQRKASNK